MYNEGLPTVKERGILSFEGKLILQWAMEGKTPLGNPWIGPMESLRCLRRIPITKRGNVYSTATTIATMQAPCITTP
jgi:hypothetical protein